MEQQNTPPAPTKSGFSPLTIRNLIPGIVVGILIGIAGFLAYERHLPQVTRTLYTVTLTSFGVLVISFVLLYAFKKQITSFIFGNATANAGEVIEDAQRVTDALTDRFADTLLRDVDSGVRDRVRHVLPRLANWFIWSRFRNWWWQWVLGIFVSLGGLTGTLLLMNQNELLEAQNIKIDSQTNLMRKQTELAQKQTELAQQQMSLSEASRRSALVVLMSNIMDKVDREIESQQKRLSFKQKEKRKYKLSQSLIGQIVALSHSFKPYQYMEMDSLIEWPLSPERGQLLITLSLLPLDTATLHKVYKSATFESADLKNAVLNKAYLSRANFSGANFSGADFNEADLSGANLSGADLIGADLSRADLRGADLSGAILVWVGLRGANLSDAILIDADLTEAILVKTDLSGAILRGADFSGANLAGADLNEAVLCGVFLGRDGWEGADLSDANLRGADLRGADLRGADLRGADFISEGANLLEANLSGADLNEADLNEANLSINQLSKSKSLYQCRDLHDTLKLPLQKSHPHLFQKPKEDEYE
jgi:uncharacterized protein YjbI with pentapeptide repeats